MAPPPALWLAGHIGVLETSIVRSYFQPPDQNAFYRHSPPGPRAAPVHITAMAERTSGIDESLGHLLRDMRLAIPMTQGELALRLAASVEVIALLEQGRLRALPHWDETQRVICGLCALHRVDPRPILQRIIEQTSTARVGAPPERGPRVLQRAEGRQPERTAALPPKERPRRTQHAAPRPAAPSPSPPLKSEKKRLRRRRMPIGRGGGRVLMAVATPIVLIAGAIWTIQAQPRVLREVIEVLPASISRPTLAGLDSLAVRLSPRRDGLRWIDVADPSTRKADKLQVVSHK